MGMQKASSRIGQIVGYATNMASLRPARLLSDFMPSCRPWLQWPRQ